MNKPYYIIRKEGRNIQVRFAHMPKKVFSTGTRDLDEAIKFAEEHVGKTREEITTNLPMTLRNFAEGIFSEDDPRGAREYARLRNRMLSEEQYRRFASLLDNYILPRFGNFLPKSITEDMVARWIIKVRAVRTRELLTNRSRRDILKCFSLVMQAAMKADLIENNPLRHLEADLAVKN